MLGLCLTPLAENCIAPVLTIIDDDDLITEFDARSNPSACRSKKRIRESCSSSSFRT